MQANRYDQLLKTRSFWGVERKVRSYVSLPSKLLRGRVTITSCLSFGTVPRTCPFVAMVLMLIAQRTISFVSIGDGCLLT